MLSKEILIAESLLFIGAGAVEKKNPEPLKNGPAPQHWTWPI